MCNLYRMTSPREAVARLFNVKANDSANYAEEIYPGYPGLVVVDGQLQAMNWGFPLVLKSKRTGQPLKPKPVNNTREDKLHTSFWRDSFAKRRCLIPVSQWAEAAGETGRMTRIWYGLPDRDLFAVAGIWRPTIEWGNAYSMVMVDSCAFMAEAHDRMPTILHEADWQKWTAGTPDEALALCQVWRGKLTVNITSDPWSARTAMTSTPRF
jgi:putative SOS response-associated peptidase YedK